MANIKIMKVNRSMINKIARGINKAGISILAISGGVLAGSTSACVMKATAIAAGLTEKPTVNAAIDIGCSVAGVCVASATSSIIESRLLEEYADALESRNASLAIIDNAYQE